MPSGQQLIWARRSGALRRTVDQLAQRGIVPTVTLPGGSGAIALAQTLQEAGQPVYVLIPKPDLIESTAWRDCPVWAQGANADPRRGVQRWACLPLADPRPGARYVSDLLLPIHKAGVQVRGVFFDDEGQPNAWNGNYEAQRDSAQCHGHYPAGALDDFRAFQRYTLELRATLTRQVMADPVHQIYPRAEVGNFGDCLSTAQVPFVGSNGAAVLPFGCGGDVAMPTLYSDNALLGPFAKTRSAVTQSQADQVYFYTLLRTLSTCAPNARAASKRLVPYVGQTVLTRADRSLRLGLSDAMWRELLYHLWLRGADGMYLFNVGTTPTDLPASYSFGSIEAAREVYDELLAHREYLEDGEPMNYAYPKTVSDEVVWSGLRLADRCLIRAFTSGPTPKSIQVTAFPGVTVTLVAPPHGATYIVRKSGVIPVLRDAP